MRHLERTLNTLYENLTQIPETPNKNVQGEIMSGCFQAIAPDNCWSDFLTVAMESGTWRKP